MLLALMMWMQACLGRLLPSPAQRLRAHPRRLVLSNLHSARAHTMGLRAGPQRDARVLASIHAPHRQHPR